MKRNELKIDNVNNKDCNEIFDKGYYTCGDISIVRNWPHSLHGMLIVFNSFNYVAQFAISSGGSIKNRFNDRINNTSTWTNWLTIQSV